MEARRREEEDEQGLKPLRRGWCLGIEEFRQNMLELMERKLGVGRTNLRSDVLPSASPPRSAAILIMEEMGAPGEGTRRGVTGP